MKTVTMNDINNNLDLFNDFNHFISIPNFGECKLVAIHKADESTEEAYRGYNDSTLVSLIPTAGGEQLKRLIDNDSHFDISPIKK